MTSWEGAQAFDRREVVDYDAATGIQDTTKTYRVATDFEGSEGTFAEIFARFLEEPEVSEIKALSVGFWGNDYSDIEYCVELPALLIEAASGALSQLETLFVGDIFYEDDMISSIEQFELGDVINAFKHLKHFKARGGKGLGLSGLKSATLELLILETGGMEADTVRQLTAGDLPNLTHLELWTGSSDYGATVKMEDVMPLLAGTAYPELRYPFPKLKHLGIVNSELADKVAEALRGAKVLDLITSLDLSMGLLSDAGAKALAENEGLAALESLDVSANYVADETLLERIESRGVAVVNSGQRPAHEDYWYVEVGE